MNPMKLSHLLRQRSALLRQLRLAHLAFAAQALGDFSARVARAGLRGRVVLRPIDPANEEFCVTLTALDASQSVLEEHFVDEDLILLADVLGFVTGDPARELTFHLDRLDEFLVPVRTELEQAGVEFDLPADPVPRPHSD
jgi:hypothetical protein